MPNHCKEGLQVLPNRLHPLQYNGQILVSFWVKEAPVHIFASSVLDEGF
jgi:hypothetical protein